MAKKKYATKHRYSHVLTLVIATKLDCFSFYLFSREDLRKLLLNLNKRKEEIKRNGIWVDGKHYRIRFKGTNMLFFFVLNVVGCNLTISHDDAVSY